MALTYAWMDVSQDPIVCNDKKQDYFWRQVLKSFQKETKKEKKDQVYFRWGKTNKKVMLFNDLYNIQRQW